MVSAASFGTLGSALLVSALVAASIEVPSLAPPIPGPAKPYRIGYVSGEQSLLRAGQVGGTPVAAVPPDFVGADDADAEASGARLTWVSRRTMHGESEQDGEIWFRSDASTDPEPLTDDDFIDRRPALSPDGKLIAFESDRAGSWDIWIVGTDGVGLRRLTGDIAADSWPSWSPDSTAIAYSSTRDDPAGDIHVIGVAGGTPRRITAHPAADTEPAWSPVAGGPIAFTTTRFQPLGDVVSVPATGGAVTRLVPAPWDSSEPAWSPGGGSVAFVTRRDDLLGDVRVVGAAGPADRPVHPLASQKPVAETHPTWRVTPDPDGDRVDVVYTELDGGHGESPLDIWSADARGHDRRNLTSRDGSVSSETVLIETGPAFSADGTKLAYSRTEGSFASTAIVVADADGRSPRTLSTPVRHDLDPTWSPDGRLIAFSRTRVDLGATVTIVRVADGAVVATVPQPVGADIVADGEPAWSPDGRRIAFTRVTTTTPPSPSPSPSTSSSSSASPSISPSPPFVPTVTAHLWVATVSRPSPDSAAVVSQRDLSPLIGTPCPSVTVHDRAPAWSPDGRSIAFARGRPFTDGSVLCVSNAEATAARRPIPVNVDPQHPSNLVRDPAWSPDGARIAFGAFGEGAGQIWDLPGGGGTPAAVVDGTGLKLQPAYQVLPARRIALSVGVTPQPGFVGGDDLFVTYLLRNDTREVLLFARLDTTLPVPDLPLTGVLPAGPCQPDGRRCVFQAVAPGVTLAVRVALRPVRSIAATVAGTLVGTLGDRGELTVTASAPLRVLQPVLQLNPGLGPPGIVTMAFGRDFPAGAQVRLAWSAGISATPGTVTVGPDGTFATQVLVFRRDRLGPRTLAATRVRGTTFGPVQAPFLVVPRTADPPRFEDRGGA